MMENFPPQPSSIRGVVRFAVNLIIIASIINTFRGLTGSWLSERDASSERVGLSTLRLPLSAVVGGHGAVLNMTGRKIETYQHLARVNTAGEYRH